LERKQLMDAKKEWNDIVCYKRSKPRPWGQMSTTHEIYKLGNTHINVCKIKIGFRV
jgi:hypothetical protein